MTNRDFLFTTRWVKSLKSLIVRPSEALPLVGLYLRQQGRFITFATAQGKSIATTPAASFAIVAAHAIVPALWQWESAFKYLASPEQNEPHRWLVQTLIHRLGEAIAARDRLHVALFCPQERGIQHDVLAQLDHTNLLLMAAFDSVARLAHHVLGSRSSIRDAGWQRDRWIKDLASHSPRLGGLVQRGSRSAHVLTILGAFRNTIHGELAPLMYTRERAQPMDTSVALPRQEAAAVLRAMDALGGRTVWGIVPMGASSVRDAFVRPGPFVEQLLQQASRLLDDLLTETLVERLGGTSLPSAASSRPANPSELFSAESSQRIRWQLGL